MLFCITIAIRLVNPHFLSYQAVVTLALHIHTYCWIIASWWYVSQEVYSCTHVQSYQFVHQLLVLSV